MSSPSATCCLLFALAATGCSSEGRLAPIEVAAVTDRPPHASSRCVTFAADVLFAENEVLLDSTSQARLVAVIDKFRALDVGAISIDGHADPAERGDAVALSQRRADLVEAAFLARGVDASRLRVSAMGSMRPAAPGTVDGTDRPDGRRLNRRVEIAVVDSRVKPTTRGAGDPC